MIITTDIFIDDIYNHLQKICQQNKTTLPPRDNETLEKITHLVESNLHHTSFKFALEQSIPRSLEQINQECPGLNGYQMERLGKVNKQHYRWFKEDMVFQKGTAEFIHTYGRFIPSEEFLFRTNSALNKSRQINILPIERWSFVSGSLWEFIKSEKIEVNKTKIKPLAIYPLRKMPKRNFYHFDH